MVILHETAVNSELRKAGLTVNLSGPATGIDQTAGLDKLDRGEHMATYTEAKAIERQIAWLQQADLLPQSTADGLQHRASAQQSWRDGSR